MQMMCLSSEEGNLDGLGWIDGTVKHFRNLKDTSHQNFEVPHMGWNSIEIKKKNKLLDKIGNNSRFYFLHSYYFSEKDSDIVMMQTDYIDWFTSCFQKDNIIGIQFHPEKSHSMGIQLLNNFSKL
jgi:imidazole glycerol phosphate synthase, glutamine amidotransferase subunit